MPNSPRKNLLGVITLLSLLGCATPGEQDMLTAFDQVRSHELADAEQTLSRCVATVTHPPSLRQCYSLLANVQLLREDWGAAAASFSRSFAMRDGGATQEGDGSGSAQSLFHWGWALLHSSDDDAETRRVLERARQTARSHLKLYREGHLWLAASSLALAELERRQSNEEAALKYERDAARSACQTRELKYLSQKDVEALYTWYIPTAMLVQMGDVCAKEGRIEHSRQVWLKAQGQAKARSEDAWLKLIQARLNP